MKTQAEINKLVQKQIKQLEDMIIIVHAENKEINKRIKGLANANTKTNKK